MACKSSPERSDKSILWPEGLVQRQESDSNKAHHSFPVISQIFSGTLELEEFHFTGIVKYEDSDKSFSFMSKVWKEAKREEEQNLSNRENAQFPNDAASAPH